MSDCRRWWQSIKSPWHGREPFVTNQPPREQHINLFLFTYRADLGYLCKAAVFSIRCFYTGDIINYLTSFQNNVPKTVFFLIFTGTVDFYPNGGAAQPNSLVPPSSHSRSWELYEESVLHPRNFKAVKCTDWETFLDGSCNKNEQAYMGYEATPGIQGKFFLKTSGSPHYGLGQGGVEISEDSELINLPTTSMTSKLINRMKRAFL